VGIDVVIFYVSFVILLLIIRSRTSKTILQSFHPNLINNNNNNNNIGLVSEINNKVLQKLNMHAAYSRSA